MISRNQQADIERLNRVTGRIWQNGGVNSGDARMELVG